MERSDQIPLLPAEEHARRRRRARSPEPALWDLLDAIPDPEIPVVSIWELGILQDVRRQDGEVVVTITPTYSGCPAMAEIERDIRDRLRAAGHGRSRVEKQLSPAWSTSWISDEARQKLRAYGIAPPGSGERDSVSCPHCGSERVHSISEFGSTACKALYQCDECREPFDHFKAF